jgi:hypothetical protein
VDCTFDLMKLWQVFIHSPFSICWFEVSNK